ncbi:glycosyltransferase family 2 protein [Siansivirga zeaxanthinifaciens]|uniref:Glycosyl transferase family 2 n=1 Tax=Siansivirga zeaxanthinifaciens CC-SAMT-1 TaxID=1454006 RepID=A0A0C5WDU6_9FLAO|nr:glycosyltransferase family 2 protein [Siansivirga zeaxanthinifaciens]AJR03419.1 glycosyl transferase family 2 [Siansivirga zeaxanthinifaciens CC-SAMT-1]
MKLSVIILNYNVRHFLELCIKSVQAAIKNLDAEIIVVDNNSKDHSCDMVLKLFPEILLIQNKENLGFSKANNLAVAQAKGEFICILNPDTVVAEDTFDALLKFSQSKDKLGIVGCKLVNGSGLFLPESKRNIPYVSVSLSKILGRPKKYYANHLEANAVGQVDILVGAFMFLKKTVFDEVQGFDEDYFMYGEDIDLSYKVLKAGYKNYYFGELTAIHFKGESTLKDKHYARRFYGAMQIFYEKHFKTNLFFDLVVWLGIKFFYFFRKIPKIHKKNISNYVLISDEINENLKNSLKKPLVLKDKLDINEDNIEVILDGNFLSYKKIIQLIEDNFIRNKKVTYKILPEKSKFILGSDSGFVRGEILKFK